MSFDLPNLASRPNHTNERRKKNNLINDFFNDFFYQSFPSLYKSQDMEGNFLPKIDICETSSDYHLEVELPGIDQKDIEVKIDNNILTIKGKKEVNNEKKDRNYYMNERMFGSFQRSMALPNTINEDNIEAKFKDGVLEIKILKKDLMKSKNIEIKKEINNFF